MRVKGIRWVGVRTDRLAEMRAFAADVLGLDPASKAEDFVELRAADGSKLELFGAAAAAGKPETFATNDVVVGFLVDDIRGACELLARTPGVGLLGELRVMPDGYAWQHFRAPDGQVYELTARSCRARRPLKPRLEAEAEAASPSVRSAPPLGRQFGQSHIEGDGAFDGRFPKTG